MVSRLKRTAEDCGLPFGERTMTCNSRLAQELGLWAETKGIGNAFHMAAFRAYFVDGINLAKIPALLQLVQSVGLPLEEAEEVLASRSFKEAVDQDWAESRFKSINAVPTFVMNHHKLVGAESYENIVGMVTENGVKKRQ
jgi:predicted DsbA family dithiol-disulfide isomerase